MVTEISGRGVGLDVVATRLRALAGSIDIRSQQGLGLTIELRFQASLVATHALFVRDTATRRAAGLHTPPLDEDLLRALPSLPDCAGVALGVDRLVALATSQNELKAVLAFAH